MGIFYKYIIQPLLAKSLGKKAFTNNPYLGMVIEASDCDVIADELFRVGLAYYEGAYMLPKDVNKALLYFRKAAERGHAVAQTFMVMGSMNYNDDHNEEVMYWLQKAAEQGERKALYNLGISYHRGDLNGMVD
ncbi:MAG: sel1 repeat family protein, partial [Alistipes sp.]|nr:sel1 repeat family protein [Alistipes sp.]